VALVTVFVISRGMAETLDFPGGNAVTSPAVITEPALVDIKMTFGAGKVRMKKGVIHTGNICGPSKVFGMTTQAVLMRFMKAQLGFKCRDVRKRVALQAHFISYSLPGDVTGFTVGNEFVGAAQKAGFGGFIIGVKPYGKPRDQCDQ